MHRIMTTMLATSILVITAVGNVHAENSSEKPCPCQKKQIMASHHGRHATNSAAITTSASRPGHRVAGHPITTAHSRAGHRPHHQTAEQFIEKKA